MAGLRVAVVWTTVVAVRQMKNHCRPAGIQAVERKMTGGKMYIMDFIMAAWVGFWFKLAFWFCCLICVSNYIYMVSKSKSEIQSRKQTSKEASSQTYLKHQHAHNHISNRQDIKRVMNSQVGEPRKTTRLETRHREGGHAPHEAEHAEGEGDGQEGYGHPPVVDAGLGSDGLHPLAGLHHGGLVPGAVCRHLEVLGGLLVLGVLLGCLQEG